MYDRREALQTVGFMGSGNLAPVTKLTLVHRKDLDDIEKGDYFFGQLEDLLIEYASCNAEDERICNALDRLKESKYWWDHFFEDPDTDDEEEEDDQS